MRQIITCPETAHLESLEYYEDPTTGKILGITGCTRFSSCHEVTCNCLCAKRINERLVADVKQLSDPADADDSVSPSGPELLPQLPSSSADLAYARKIARMRSQIR